MSTQNLLGDKLDFFPI
uniref:Uncharacterized protein n=1 Tax=Rhizophora mucronata TaxID=61149 RepID=A0A2P2N1R1_RHIMU